MFVSILAASLLAAQAAPAAPASGPGAQIQAAAQAFSGCIGPKVPAVPAAMTPDQGADSVLAACKSEQTALSAAVEAMIATAPADKQAVARQQLASGMAQARAKIAASITEMRAAPATPATPPAK